MLIDQREGPAEEARILQKVSGCRYLVDSIRRK
jgi:hypothetical protein